MVPLPRAQRLERALVNGVGLGLFQDGETEAGPPGIGIFQVRRGEISPGEFGSGQVGAGARRESAQLRPASTSRSWEG